jgi:tRNA G18 (ribose-2'-O)-methylase SpoU
MDIRQVSSLESPELQPYCTLRRPLDHIARGIFVAEGWKVVLRLLHSELTTISVLLMPEWLQNLENQAAGKLRDVTLYLAPKEVLQRVVGFRIHEGIMAVAKVPPEASVRALPVPHVIMALDGLRSSENVGVIARVCGGFGADLLIASERACSPYLRRAVRNSMGAVFRLPVAHPESLGSALAYMRAEFGTRIIACSPQARNSIYDCDLTGNVCLVAGNEDTGISEPVAVLEPESISIPMRNGTDSLNVASAAAVFLFEAFRQRGSRGVR